MAARDVFGLLGAVLVLAGLSVAIVNGSGTAQVLGAAGNSFSTVIRAATLR